MEFQILEFGLERRPLALRFLHAVFAEDAVTRFDDRTYIFG